ncbi:MAG: hypothetical protein JRM80_04345 [Nitrososphaerota archaeon]|nr:hypothetical protein [Nitrososphaerota archaeon]
MRTWVAMYTIIWLAFFEILLVLFPVFDFTINVTLHGILGVGILAFAFYVQRSVRRTSCPARIKRIATTTFALAIFQGALGLALVAGIELSWGSIFADITSFLHVATSIAIITQASSSATAFDMWEEKEFQANPA